MRSRILFATAALTLLACSPEETITEPSVDPSLRLGDRHAYRAIDLGAFSPGDINPRGQIVGSSTITPGQFQFHAFLWKHGVMIDLGTLGGRNSGAEDINAAGQVVGFAETADQVRHAVLWQNGVVIDLGAIAGGTESFASSITPAGDVLGEVDGRATLWTRQRR